MASKLLATHTLPCPPTTTRAPSARRTRLALPIPSSSSSSFRSNSFLFATATASRAVGEPRRSGILTVARAAEGDEAPAAAAAAEDAGALENGAAEEEEAALSEEEGEVAAPRKPIVKLGDIMGILHKRAIEASEKERPVPDIRTGDIVEIKMEVPENRRRASIYKGIVMSKQNAGIQTTIRIRRIVAGIGVEIVFPVHSPNVKEIKVVSHRKVRRARLYYLRDKLPRFSTFK